MSDSFEEHRSRVERIASKVADARNRGETPTIYHGSSHSVRAEDYETDKKIHVERLDHFIQVEEEEHKALLEPDITMRKLVEETLEHGLIPKVVPEFPTITVGGAIQGGAGESTCFREGLFHETCERLEIVTGKGEILDASSEENTDLYHGTACS